MSEQSNVVARPRRFQDEELSSIKTIDDALSYLDGKINVTDTVISTGFDVIDKQYLVGVPFVILDWHFSMGDNGEFVSVMVITRDNRKCVFNDGSSGVYAQMKRLDYSEKLAIFVPGGLRANEYIRKDEDGEPLINPKSGLPERATTYRIDTRSE